MILVAQSPDFGDGFVQQLGHFTPPQLINPACTMASRTAAFDPLQSDRVTIGSRTEIQRTCSSRDRAYLTGAGLVSMNEVLMQRHQLVLDVQRQIRNRPAGTRSGNSAQRRGATFEVTEMQPWPPWAMKPSAVASSPDNVSKSRPRAARCCDTRVR